MGGARPVALVVAALLAVGLASCSADGTDEAPDGTGAEASALTPIGADDAVELAAVVDRAAGCDPLDQRSCLLPFPSDHFTAVDVLTATGRRVSLPQAGALPNAAGAELDVAEWNRNDGFSPGTPILTHVPGVDLEASGAPPIGDIAQSLEETSATVLVDVQTGERIPHWVELDATATDHADQLLIIRPAVALPEGHTVAVGLQSLVDGDRDVIHAPLAFRAYRDDLVTDIATVEERREAMEEVLDALDGAGARRGDLYLAWGFTVSSERSLTERLLEIRDDAFDRLGDAAPAFTVDGVVADPALLEPGIARVVRGTFGVPLYLTGDGGPGTAFNTEEGGELPAYAEAEHQASFSCQVPQSAVEGNPRSARPVVYGHGLLGSHTEVESSDVAYTAARNAMVYCATDWIGMSAEDVPNAIAVLRDISTFRTVADRVQQGILNTLFLARLATHPDGLSSHEAFAGPEGVPVIDTTEAYFDSNSQGAIIGGAATAVSTEWTRAVLGVPGMNYSTLLQRSTDWAAYQAVMATSYPGPLEQQLAFGLLQMLWDRAETNGYAHHLTEDPLPGTPSHEVMLQVAFGDHQVSTVTAEVLARTAGIPLRRPALGEGRHPDDEPFFGLGDIDRYPYDGSVLVYVDSGALPPSPANLDPTFSAEWQDRCAALVEPEVGLPPCVDPHGDPRRDPTQIAMEDAFLRPDGQVTDPCDGDPCTAEPRALLDY